MIETNKNYLKYFFRLFLLLLFITGCAVPHGRVYEKDGRRYGVTDGLFQQKWNDFYLRGLSYADGTYWEDAARDFQEAIRQRDKDQRRARTYGLHFMDYFPNRELGISFYYLGKYEQAIQCFEASLFQAETARAKFYLNKARRNVFDQAGRDTGPPGIIVVSPQPGYITNKFSTAVSYAARDDSYVSRVIINGKETSFELAQKEVSGQEVIALNPGNNTVTLQAEDLTGKMSLPATALIQVDREGPLVFLEARDAGGGAAAVGGAVYDRSGVVRLTLNNKPVAGAAQKTVRVDEQVAPSASGRITFSAEDSAGNITAGYIQAKGAGMAGRPFITVAAAQCANVLSDAQPFLLPAGKAPARSASLDRPAAAEAGGGIELKGLRDGQTVFLETIFIEGTAASPSGVKDITVNGFSVVNFQADATLAALLSELTQKQKRSFAFSKLVNLNVGGNTIVIALHDGAGAVVEKKMTIVRKISRARDIGSRLAVTIYPFKEKKNAPEPLSDYVQAMLTSALVSQRRFNVLERTQLQQILDEQKISQEAIFDPATAVRLGRMLAAETVLVGDIFATDTSVEIVARMVDTETSLILAEKDVYWEGKPKGSFRDIIEGLGIKFMQHFPLCEGKVIRSKTDEIIFSLGKADGLTQGMRFMAFEEGEPIIHPDTGLNLGSDTELLSILSVREINDKFSKAAVVKKLSEKLVTQKALVITK